MTGKLNGMMILEIMGRPKETIEGALKAVVDKLSKEKGIKVTNTIFHDTLPVEKANDLFTTFVEVEIEFDSLEVYYYTLFAYMPSNVQIFNPDKIDITNQHLTEFGNKLLQRLHDYDAVVKRTLSEKNFLAKKLYEFAPHLFKKPENNQPLVQADNSNKEPSKKVNKKKSKKKSNKK